MEVFDPASVLIFYDEQEVEIPCDGWSQTFNYGFTVTSEGEHLVRATLYDQHDELMDIKEICITVRDGTPPPNDEEKMVWIASLATDKDEYDVNEIVNIQVVVERGNDLLTYVWEGTLVLEIMGNDGVTIFTEERPVYLPHGGASETHDFGFTPAEPGNYIVRATLYDFHDEVVDIMEIKLVVGDDNSGGDGTTPPNDGDGTTPPNDGDKNVPPNDVGLFTGDRAGALQDEREKQVAMIIIVLMVLLGLSAFATLCHYKRQGKTKRGS
jgi:hypothetical protein